MMALARRVLYVLALLVVAGAAWLFRPWSPYSPYEMLGALDPARRLETLRGFDALFPHRMIAADAAGTPLPRREAPLDVVYDWRGERKLVERFLDEATVTGLLVLKNGAIVHERYRLGADAESRFASFALSTGVVAALIGVSEQQGLITSLDEPAESYAPALEGSDLGATSLHDLLAMSAGTAFDDDYGALGSDVYRLYFDAFVLSRNPDRLAARVRRVGPPGETVDIAPPDSQALAAVVAAVHGKPLADVVEETLWAPLGMTESASWSQNRGGRGGVALGFCCWSATLQDIARFGDFLRRDGVWEGTRLLPEGWLAAATQPSASFAAPGVGGDLGPWGYGLGFYVPEDARGAYLLAGEFGQYLWIDPRRRVVVAMVGADEDWLERRAEATEVLRHIAAAVE